MRLSALYNPHIPYLLSYTDYIRFYFSLCLIFSVLVSLYLRTRHYFIMPYTTAVYTHNTDGEFAPVTMTISCVGVFAVSTLASHYRTTSAASIKSSLLFSTKLMAIILVVLGTYCHLHGSLAVHYSDGYRHIPFVCLVLLYVTFAFGPFRLTSEYVDHIIPAQIYFNVRCLLTAVNWLLIYVMISVLPGLISNIGVGWLFWFMALMCMFMAFFVRRCMPTVTAPKPSQFVWFQCDYYLESFLTLLLVVWNVSRSRVIKEEANAKARDEVQRESWIDSGNGRNRKSFRKSKRICI